MNDQNVWSEKPEFHGDPGEYTKTRVLMLAAVFNRKASDELQEVFREVLAGYPFEVLAKAFSHAERTLERFPTPKLMRELCTEHMPATGWMYRYREADGTDPETGTRVKIRIDPVTGEKLYRAADCPEGRIFLSLLRRFEKKQKYRMREPGED